MKVISNGAMTVHEFSGLKLQPIIRVADASDAHTWQVREGNSVPEVLWQKLHDSPEAWGCSFVKNQVRRVSATVKYRLLPDYAPVSQKEKKKRETWVWLASITVTDGEETQTLQDGYYFFNLGEAQGYCETAALMICNKLGIAFPDTGASILTDRDGYPITRYSRVVLADGREVVATDFGWYELNIPSYDLDFQHSPSGYMQIRPKVLYLDGNQDWQSVPCCEVRAIR